MEILFFIYTLLIYAHFLGTRLNVKEDLGFLHKPKVFCLDIVSSIFC